MKKSKHKVIYIKWLDSMATNGWHQNIVNSDLGCESIGWYILKNKVGIKIALSKSSQGMYGEILEIPLCSIIERRWV